METRRDQTRSSKVESNGKWPSHFCWADISQIPKGEGCDTLSLRPITVTPIVHRIWAASRMRHSLSWQDKWMELGQHGSRSKNSTTDALVRISLELERAVPHNEPMFGEAVDLEKAFDKKAAEITFRSWESTQGCVLHSVACIQNCSDDLKMELSWENHPVLPTASFKDARCR